MKRKIVVIGSNSFSGQDFIDLLLDDPGIEVIATSRSAEKAPLFLKYRRHAGASRCRYYQIDLNRNMPQLLELFDAEKPAEIVNFAAQSEVAPSWEHPDHWFQTNTVALAQMVNHLRRQTYLKKYLHISSPEVYGTCVGTITEQSPVNPTTPYAASKAAADMLLSTYQRQFGFPLVSVRATNVYGARQQLFKIIPRSVIYMKLGRTIELHGGGVAQKSYIHIRDISQGELAVLNQGRVGELYHLSPDRAVAVREIVSHLCAITGKRFEDVTKTVSERPGQDAIYVIDSSKARSELGWSSAIPLEQGLRDVVEWVDQHWSEIKSESLDYNHKA